MENTENMISDSQANDGVTESGIYSEGVGAVNDVGTDDGEDTAAEDAENGDGSAVENGGYDALAELCRVSGKAYGSIAEFPEHERFLELMNSGILTPEEAFYAVNRSKKPSFARIDDGKKHMASSIRKPSSGEVFSRADREELAKWGISATGSELERLWREAGNG